jgi:hypothetical protein
MSRLPSDILARGDAEQTAALLTAEVVEYARKGLAADDAKEKWMALAHAKDLSHVLQGLCAYARMFERCP